MDQNTFSYFFGQEIIIWSILLLRKTFHWKQVSCQLQYYQKNLLKTLDILNLLLR